MRKGNDMKKVLLSLIAIFSLLMADEKKPLHHWVFESAAIENGQFVDRAGAAPVRLSKLPLMKRNKFTEYWELDGEGAAMPFSEGPMPAHLPKKEISVAAWVMWKVPLSWGGILGYFQDNGDAEKGWVLGFSGDRPTFGIAGSDTDDGNGKMTYLATKSSPELGTWNHLVATYDGKTTRIYLNGKLDNQTEEQQGYILYPDSGFFDIASYHDDNEYFPLTGGLKEVRLYDRTLSASEIAAQYKLYEDLNSLPGIFPREPRIIAGPYLQWATKDAISILWETNREATTRVELGETAKLGEIRTIDGQRKMHEVRITGLQTQSNYFYRVVSETDSGAQLKSKVLTFQTAVEDGSAFSFGFVSDTQNNPRIWGKVSRLLFNERPNFAIHAGDIVGTGVNNLEWLFEFLEPGMPLMQRVPLYTVLGNHEGNADNYYKYMANPSPEYWYRFKYGNAEFFMIDSNKDLGKESEQLRWLDEALSNSTATWKFVVHHHPPYTSDENDYGDTYQGPSHLGDRRLTDVIPVYEKHQVDIVFFGHIHDYERTWPIRAGKVDQESGIRYMQIGGGGGSLENYAPTRSWFTAKVRRTHHYGVVAIYGSTMEVQVMDEEGRLFDQFLITK